VYDDQFVYANDRYKMAGQWFALPKLFKASVNEGYEIIRNDRDVIQFKNEQSWTFKLIPKTATINALVTLSLDPGSLESEFLRVKYHKDQANDKDYSRECSFSPYLLYSKSNKAILGFGIGTLHANMMFVVDDGVGFSFKKWQADNVAKNMDSPEVAHFEADKGAAKEEVRKYGSGEGAAPKKDF
jgi:hypothetical protein